MRPRVTTLAHGVLFLLFAAWPGAAAYAQTQSKPFVTAYPSGYFTGSHPSSAMEMVTLLPGFRFDEGNSSVRGYGGAIGNVLIDGRPPASKQDTLSDTLKRIPSNSVGHVELMRPGVAGIDMQGYALLANVVRKVSTAPRIRLEAEYMQYPHGKSAPKWAGEISLGKTYVLDLQGSIYRDILVPFGYGSKNRYRSDGSPLQLANYDHPKYQDTWLLQGTYRMPLLGGNFRVNGLVNDGRAIGVIDEQDFYPVRTFSGGGEREMRSNNEFGVQYTHPMWGGAEVEVIGIRRSTNLHLAQGVTAAGRPQRAAPETGRLELRNGRGRRAQWHEQPHRLAQSGGAGAAAQRKRQAVRNPRRGFPQGHLACASRTDAGGGQPL